jgi:ABC-type phosphate transport system substrate-binding protein
MKKILFLVLMVFHLYSYSETATIGSKNLMDNTITKTEVRLLYLMKNKRLFNGDRPVLFHLPKESKVRDAFIREVLNMTIEQYNTEISKVTNIGLGTFIKTAKNNNDMLYRVGNTINGIGYSDKDHLLVYIGDSDVKILTIID